MRKVFLFLLCLGFYQIMAQTPKPPYTSSKFEQLGTEIPTPNLYRNAGGEPTKDYWQQKADYKIKVSLDDEKQFIKASETITYTNNSPSDLRYLWIQLDQNRFDKNAEGFNTMDISLEDQFGFYFAAGYLSARATNGGYKISNVKDNKGKAIKYVINQTMMRIDLAEPLKANGGVFTFSLDWEYNIMDANNQGLGARAGYEYFEKDDNYLYEIAQWYPRMAVYDDVNGWQNKQFLGRGEFALTFGDYEVEITVPSDHIVNSTGTLQNPKDVLTSEQISRLKKAEKSKEPVLIVDQKEVEKKEKKKAKTTKTWKFSAQNVRDFAWASSRKFIWDAMQVDVEGKKVWAMSFYPKEGNPLWGEYSTKVVAHTLEVYSKHTIAYPYPKATSTHGAVFGMEYPMVSFNGGRPRPDGTYSDRTKHSMITVIIHEVGHNFFPMIINSDERQWTWMDEGLNSFMQYIAEQAWDKDYPSEAGVPKAIVSYMKGDPKTLLPIMTTSDNIDILQFGPNAYSKPATALNILREVVMGKELFDYAFKEYARRWAFKHPEPADFFRTMEDASGVDLDWFWRGWFYTTEAVDVELTAVRRYKLPAQKDKEITASEGFEVKDLNERVYGLIGQMSGKKPEELIASGSFVYNLDFKNKGGLFTPLLIQMNFEDGSSETIKVGADIWRGNPEEVSKLIITNKEVKSFVLDPSEMTADIDTKNNAMPRSAKPSRFERFKKEGDL